MGLLTGPTLRRCELEISQLLPLGGRGGAWRMKEEDTGGGLVRCSPQNVAATALAWGIYNPVPAADGGGGSGGGGPRWKGE